jgi:hypothetical protein
MRPYDWAVPKRIIGIPADVQSIKNALKIRLAKTKIFLINMELRNGKHRSFLIKTKKQYFRYEGGTYIIDTNLMYDNVDSKFYCLDYHQDFCLPIQRKINYREVQDAIDASRQYEVESSTNPAVLTKILEANVGEGVAKSSQIPDFIKQMKLLLIIGTMSSIIMLLLFVFKTGMLKGVKIPGL